ncbi:biofilm regulation protein kinase SiaB [Bordetella genomosp. 13]|uniref:Uncharacterized protein n=1 Tax=Bordetella genomosp. 13 TaxID=463040 RepID=A0A1W6ZHL7_9BORD|nr:biofilm regulation protein kinase SiaB [Bordetella genomosp. 13]ARP96650.1 hypothetical protein CAL15_21140 [Bordetella genomosp. 13]
MNASDLYALRERFNQDRTLLCFNGPISRSLIEEIGNALKNYLEAEHTRPAEAMDVFSVYIEMIQNIRQYALQCNDAEASATVVINRRDAGGYVVSAGNVVDTAHGDRLVAMVQRLATMDKPALKAEYKAQLHKPRVPGTATGAGLGLIDIARRSSQPLQASLRPHGQDGRSFFSLSVAI